MNSDEQKPTIEVPRGGVRKYPLWKDLAAELARGGLDYGQTWPTRFFEEKLDEKAGTKEFAFAMLSLKMTLEFKHGYYLEQTGNGAQWGIPPANQANEIAAGFDHKVRRYAVRSINLRSATLLNPKAELTADERAKMEKDLEHASVRLILLSRSKSIADVVRKHHPKLLAD